MIRPFVSWLMVSLSSFGALAGGYHVHLTRHPERILVVVDSSGKMQAARADVAARLSEIGALRYREFLLYTEKERLFDHWRARLQFGDLPKFQFPRHWGTLTQMWASKELGRNISEADRIILITNAPENKLHDFSGWSIVRP